MPKKTTLHMFATEDIVRSVLKGHKVLAQCGYVTTHTREQLDAVPALIAEGRVRYCTECHAAVNTVDEGMTLTPARGWQAILERVWLAQYDAQRAAHTIRVTGTSPWTFPLAG